MLEGPLMTDAEITALVEWAETSTNEPARNANCCTCDHPPCATVLPPMPNQHSYGDQRPLALLALVGRHLLDARAAASLKSTKDVFALKCDNKSLELQLRLRTRALAELTADVESGRFRDRALQVENERLHLEIMDYQSTEIVAEANAEREMHARESQRLQTALSAQGRGIQRLRAERDRACALGHELAGLAFHLPSEARDHRIKEINAALGFVSDPP